VNKPEPLTWRNWSGKQSSRYLETFNPSSAGDFVDIVQSARTDRRRIRAVGAGHSHSRVGAPYDILVSTDQWQGIVSAQLVAKQPTVRARAGTRIAQFGLPLFEMGLALKNQGDIDRQSIAGAVATGTHGTGPTLQNLSASVVGMQLVLANGELVQCGPNEEPELFAVAQHSLGGVGLVTELDVSVRDRYLLREQLWSSDTDETLQELDSLVAASRHFEFFWMPDKDRCACKALLELSPGSGADLHPDSGLDHVAPKAPKIVSRRERVGWSHHIISSIRDDLHTEMEYAVPASLGPACFHELREMVLRHFPTLEWPLEYRTLGADNVLLSTANARATVTISVHQGVELDDAELFSACEEIFVRYDGRPHWGKVHYLSAADLIEIVPKYEHWWALRDRYDPDGLFVNDYLASLRP